MSFEFIKSESFELDIAPGVLWFYRLPSIDQVAVGRVALAGADLKDPTDVARTFEFARSFLVRVEGATIDGEPFDIARDDHWRTLPVPFQAGAVSKMMGLIYGRPKVDGDEVDLGKLPATPES